MAKITISQSNQAGDIPTYGFSKEEIQSDYFTFLEDILEKSDDVVFVCFQSWNDAEYENEHQSILITHKDEDAIEFFFLQILNIRCEDINFNFFCFENYEEAFKYCIDLKEGL